MPFRKVVLWAAASAASFLLVSCVRPKPAARLPVPTEHADSPFEAAEYFRQQRVPDSSGLPIERYLAAQRHARNMPRTSPAASPEATFGTWEALGPGNVGGRTRGLVVHPQNSKIMWLGGATGGVWKTTDGGNSWTPTTDFAPVLTVNSLAIDPDDPNTLYAGTGEQTQNWRGAGIFKTSDGGATWSQIPSTATPDFYFVNNLAVSRGASSHIYAATNSGLWSTTDGGASWKLSLASPDGGPAPTLTGGTTNGCFDVAIQPGQPTDVVFAVCHPPGSLPYAIFRNPDAAGAGTWTMVLSDPNMWYTVVVPAPSQPSTIYALSVTYDNSSPYAKGLLAVYRSTSGGGAGTWTTRTSNQDPTRLNTAILSIDSAYSFGAFCTARSPNYNGQAGYNLALAVDPLDPNLVWAAGVGIFRSDDGGANWGYAFNGAHPDQHFLAFDPGFDGAANQVLYNVSDGGIFKTTQARGKTATCASMNTGVAWTALNNGYQTTQFYHGTPYPGGGAYFGGTQDNGTLRGTGSRPGTWDSIFGGDGGVSRVDPVNINTAFVETPHGAMAKSTDGGLTYVNAANGLNEASLNFPFVAWYVFDPANSLRMYVGGTQLWRSEDGAAHWTAASAPVDQPAGALDNIRAVAISPADPNLVLFGVSHGRIFRNANALASDGSTVWNSTQPRAGNVSFLEFDPHQPSVIYATYTTFNSAPGDGHVYRSTDSGLTWTRLDGSGPAGLPDIPVETLLVDPDDSTHLYLGTDLGVFASLDGGNTWVRDDSPFANVITTTLTIDRTAGVKYLYAFTYGRGVWRVPLGGAPAAACQYSVSPANIAADPNGGTFSADVAASPNCAWAVTPIAGNFASVQGPGYGNGSGKVYFTVPANHSSNARAMTVVVANQQVTVSQPGAAIVALGDALATAYAVSSLPAQIVAPNTALTQSPSDPTHSCTGSADFRTGWMRFTAPADAILQVTAQGVQNNTGSANSGIVAAVYALNGGSLGDQLGCATVAKDSGPVRSAIVRFAVSAGAAYAVEIGSLSTGATSDLAVLYVGLGPALPVTTFDVSPPESVVFPGATSRLQAVTSGLPNPAVRWTVTPQIGVIAPDGTYSAPAGASPATITVTAQSLADSTLRSTSTLTIQLSPPVSLPAPAVTNAASFQTGAVAPGEVITIFGSGIGPSTLASAQLNPQGRLASTLAGTQVLFDNIPAPLIYAASAQVSAIVPYEVGGQSTTQMVVVRNGQSTPPVTLQVAAVAPALFTASATGSGPAAAVNQDGTLNGPQSPAPAGSIIALFATGEGQTTPGGINGRIAGTVFPAPLASVNVKIGGMDAPVVYAGAAPQSVAGLFQVNVKVPTGLPPGPNTVILTIGGASSRSDATVAIR